jgi:hypothetical protein
VTSSQPALAAFVEPDDLYSKEKRKKTYAATSCRKGTCGTCRARQPRLLLKEKRPTDSKEKRDLLTALTTDRKLLTEKRPAGDEFVAPREELCESEVGNLELRICCAAGKEDILALVVE